MNWLWVFVLGFALGAFSMGVLVLLFWISETRRYNRRFNDEHATDYVRRAG